MLNIKAKHYTIRNAKHKIVGAVDSIDVARKLIEGTSNYIHYVEPTLEEPDTGKATDGDCKK